MEELLLVVIHRISDVWQTEIRTAESLVPDPIPFEVEIDIAKLNMYKSPCSNVIPAELIQAGDEIFRSEIHNLLTMGTEIKRQEPEADHSPLSSAEDENCGAITVLPQTSSWRGV
jgi:hypothetical protein